MKTSNTVLTQKAVQEDWDITSQFQSGQEIS